jgi:hypothetical protein
MACSGPGTINLVSGLATALVDCAPVVALGGSSPWSEWGTGSFQEIDQVALARPMVKWAERCYETRRIPELIDLAFRTAWAGKPGPVYLDFPTDVLLGSVDEAAVVWPRVTGPVRSRPQADAAGIESAIGMLAMAEKPVVLSGSGVPLLYRVVAESAGLAHDLGHDAAAITDLGLRQTDRGCTLAVDAFCALLGSFAGSAALMLGARGGVLLAGGVTHVLADALPASRFRERFEAKGRFRDYLSTVHTCLLVGQHASLRGAALALRTARRHAAPSRPDATAP